MKMNIKITKLETGFLRTPTEIIDIDICNGNWKYHDDHMETEEKIPLTINTICNSAYLSLPVKDAIGFYDKKEWEENRNIIISGASVRTYDSLLYYLNCRINNAKDSCLDEHTFNCVLFEDNSFTKDHTVVNDIVYEKESLLEVKIIKVE